MFIETIVLDRELTKARTVILTLAGKPVRVSDSARLQRIIASGALTRSDIVSVQEQSSDFVAQPADQVAELRELFDKLDPPPAKDGSDDDRGAAPQAASRPETGNAAAPANGSAVPVEAPLGVEFEHAVKLLIDIFDKRLSIDGADVIALEKDIGTVLQTLTTALAAVDSLRQQILARLATQARPEQERVEQVRSAQEFTERTQIEWERDWGGRGRTAQVDKDWAAQLEWDRQAQVERDRQAQRAAAREVEAAQEAARLRAREAADRGGGARQQPRSEQAVVPGGERAAAFEPMPEYARYIHPLISAFNKISESSDNSDRFIDRYNPIGVDIAYISRNNMRMVESDVGLSWKIVLPSYDQIFIIVPSLRLVTLRGIILRGVKSRDDAKKLLPCYKIAQGPVFWLVEPALVEASANGLSLVKQGEIFIPTHERWVD